LRHSTEFFILNLKIDSGIFRASKYGERDMSFKWQNAFSKALLSSVAVLGLSTHLEAASDNTMSKPNFAFAYPKDLNLANPYDYYFWVEGLAFQGMETGLEYAVVNDARPAGSVVGRIAGFGRNESWDYNPGTRVGAGLYFDHDAWSLDFDWMWVNITNSQTAQGTGTTDALFVPEEITGIVLAAPFTSAAANWGCTVNVLDSTLGKPYYISRKVIFNPHCGLRFAWIGQELGVDYAGPNPAKSKNENDFFGVGARFGFDTDWLLGYGVKMFSNLSSSILAGWFDTSWEFSVPTLHSKISNDLQMVVPNLELALGFDWGTTLYDCRYYLSVRGGYEFQVWWDQWNTRIFGDAIGTELKGNLTLNGFTLKVQLDI
jgi:Legionella pneumophila major outer membrane protein precursor